MHIIQSVLSEYDLGEFHSLPVRIPSKNDVYEITSEKGRFILKQVPLSKKDLFYNELVVTKQFEQAHLLPSGYLIETKDKKKFVIFGFSYFVLYKHLQGQVLGDRFLRGKVEDKEINLIMEVLVRLHGLKANARLMKGNIISAKIREIETYPHELSEIIKNQLIIIKNQLISFLVRYNEFGGSIRQHVIHGDLYLFNIILSDHLYFIDLDEVKMGNFMQDIAGLLIWFLVRKERIDYDQISSFMKAYGTQPKKEELLLLFYLLKVHAFGVTVFLPRKLEENKIYLHRFQEVTLYPEEICKELVHTTEEEFLQQLTYDSAPSGVSSTSGFSKRR